MAYDVILLRIDAISSRVPVYSPIGNRGINEAYVYISLRINPTNTQANLTIQCNSKQTNKFANQLISRLNCPTIHSPPLDYSFGPGVDIITRFPLHIVGARVANTSSYG